MKQSRFLTRTNINSAVMIAEKVLGIAINLVVFAVLARSLGPQIFGLFGLVQAVFNIGLPVAMVVCEQTMVKFQVGHNNQVKSLQKSAIMLKVASSIAVYLLTVSLSYFYFEKDVFYLIAAFCMIHLLNFELIFHSYFRAVEKSHLVLVSKACVLIPFGLIKIFIAVKGLGLQTLAWTYVAEAIFMSITSYVIYNYNKPVNEKNTTQTKISELASASAPIFLSAFLIALYVRIDQFMIEHYLSHEELGLYTAAGKLSQASQHILLTLLISRFAYLLRVKKQSEAHYEKIVVETMRWCLPPWLIVVLTTYFFGESILQTIYGQEYLLAKESLVLLSIGTIFVYYGVICTQWLMAENLQRYRLLRVFAGLVINIILNAFLIPWLGISGAAIATIISQSCSAVLFNSLHSKTRPIFNLQIKSLLPFWR